MIKRFSKSITSYLGQAEFRQVVALSISKFGIIFIGIMVSSMNTRQLKPELFGNLALIISLTGFFQLLLYPGIFQTGSRLLALNSSNKENTRELIGGLLLVGLGFALLMSLITFGYSFVNDHLFKNQIGLTIRTLSIFVFVYPLLNCINNILQGQNKIYSLSAFTLLPYLIYLFLLLIFFDNKPSVLRTSILYFTSFSVVVVFFIIYINPSFRKIGKSLRSLKKANKGFGSKLYFGSIFITSLNYLNSYTVAYFCTQQEFGLYALAFTIAFPVSIIPSLFGVTYFSKFANENEMPFKRHMSPLFFSALGLVVFLIFISPLFHLIYDREFEDSLFFTYLLSIPSLILGIGDYFNKYNLSKGNSRSTGVFMVSLATLLVGVFFSLILVPRFSVRGIIFSQFFSSMVYCAGMLYLSLRNNNTL